MNPSEVVDIARLRIEALTSNATTENASAIMREVTIIVADAETEVAALAANTEATTAKASLESIAAAAAAKVAALAAAGRLPTPVLEMNPVIGPLYRKDPVLFVEFLRQFAAYSRQHRLPIVSVGSGCGGLEHWMVDTFGCQIYCCDPDPCAWATRCGRSAVVVMEPAAATVGELLDRHPELGGGCLALFNWPDPALDYDYEALDTLVPILTLSLYSGAAHSSDFHKFFNGMTPPAPARCYGDDSQSLGEFHRCLAYMTTPRYLRMSMGVIALCGQQSVPLDAFPTLPYASFDPAEMRAAFPSVVVCEPDHQNPVANTRIEF